MVLPERDVTFPPINLATLSRLRTLGMTCVEPQSLVGLSSSLEELTLYDVKSPIDMSLFSNSTTLSSLCLCKCLLSEVEFDDVLGQQLEKLHSLEVRDSELLERLFIARLKGLRRLSVFGCPRLMDFEVVEELKSLVALFIWMQFRKTVALAIRNKEFEEIASQTLSPTKFVQSMSSSHLTIEGCGAFPSFDGACKKWKDTQSGRY
ncbi:DNA-directed RNA polymerase subunit [Psidium guajava]|nr:DNA-directed RNA polymerase subunit [Psidium guajava]